jgi:phosphoglycolate phosphatase-like HAD superfamily hydrolase
MPVIALFDIDGTLVDTGGAGARSWSYAFELLYGVRANIGAHTSAGETDPFVARATFEAAIGRAPALDELARLYAAYLLRLSDDLKDATGYRVLDGVESTLRTLSDAGVALGIVSGAIEGAGRMKLMPGDLNRYFVFGAYGSDSPDRTAITELAMHKAERLLGEEIDRGDVFVVGDTPLDVLAAKKAGATSVAVASGKYSVDRLRATGADHVLPSLASGFPGMPPVGERSG